VTAAQKTAAVSFLDLYSDYLGSGCKAERGEYAFADDPATGAARDSPAAAGQTAAGSPVTTADSLEKIAADVAACRSCGLCKTRKNPVPGEGVPRPLVMVIGEGPGADEDATGRPFVGRAGQLLDQMLFAKGQICLSRTTNCFIANMVKCRPPENRNPDPEEITACNGFLRRQIALLKPLVIVSAGNVPTKALLGTGDGITRMRGRWNEYEGIPLLPTFHPSALLRDESLKAFSWEDMKTLRAKLQRLSPEYAAQFDK
jgi:DNA polymerase